MEQHSLVILVLASSCLAILAVDESGWPHDGIIQPNREQYKKHLYHQEQHQSDQPAELEHPPLLVDRKFWIRHNDFANSANWRNSLKPCSLLETISINDEAVISLGGSGDTLAAALESDIKDLLLPMNGLFLLDQILPHDTDDYSLRNYLNSSGDCYEGEQDPRDGIDEVFQFEMPSDHMSWFNPDNWVSVLNEDLVSDWVPDANTIPCTEDIVVFGHTLLGNSKEDAYDSISSNMGFKVNFQPSSWVDFPINDTSDYISNLRVSKLRIGDQFYSQSEFDHLVNSGQYANILFEFDHKLSLLRSESRRTGYQASNPLLTIDESSIRSNSDHDLCLDEAGCICGNENLNVMRAICSFHEPLKTSDYPCYDPISSSGYCNKICATVIVLQIDPIKFSERFLNNAIVKAISETNDGYFSRHVFAAARRTQPTKYEITLRPVPGIHYEERADYGIVGGSEIEFAQLIMEAIDKNSLKSFYGIKSISVKSSIEWRSSNHTVIFFLCLTLSLGLITLVLLLEEKGLLGRRVTAAGTDTNFFSQNATGARRWLLERFQKLLDLWTGGNRNPGETDSFLRYAEPVVDDLGPGNDYDSVSGIPLVEVDTVSFNKLRLEYKEEK